MRSGIAWLISPYKVMKRVRGQQLPFNPMGKILPSTSSTSRILRQRGRLLSWLTIVLTLEITWDGRLTAEASKTYFGLEALEIGMIPITGH